MTPQAQILIVSPQMSINVLQAYYETPSDKNKNMPRSPRKATDSFVCICFDLFLSLQFLWFCMKLNIVFRPPGMSRTDIKLLEIMLVPLAPFQLSSEKSDTHLRFWLKPEALY